MSESQNGIQQSLPIFINKFHVSGSDRALILLVSEITQK